MGLANGWQNWRELPIDRKMRVIVPSAIALISALAVPAFALVSGDDDSPAPAPVATATDLELIDLRVANDRASAEPDGTPIPAVPTVSVRLHNKGNQRSVLTDAELTIEQVARVEFCQAGGSLDVSGKYDVVVPASTKVGDTIEVPLSQQLGADEADVFDLTFTTDPEDDAYEYRMYEVSLALRHDNAKRPLDAGRFLISVPFAPQQGDLLDAENEASSERACYAKNEAAVAALLQSDAARSQQFDALAAYLAAKG